MNELLKNTKNYLFKNTWIFWGIVFLIVVSVSYSLKTGVLVTGLLANGLLIGCIIPICILTIQKRTNVKSLFLPFLFISIITLTMYISLENKAVLVYSIPFGIPTLAAGLLSLRK